MKVIIKLFFRLSLIIVFFPFAVFQSCDRTDEGVPKGIVEKPPTWIEYQGDITDPCKTLCLTTDQNSSVGTVEVAEEGDYLLVRYTITASDVYLKALQFELFNTVRDLYDEEKITGGGPATDKFEYKVTWGERGKTTSYTIGIPLTEIGDENACIFMAAHADLTDGRSVWGGLCDFDGQDVVTDGAKQFPGAAGAGYFEFCRQECFTLVDFTYAWEDLTDLKNDMDYNDLVIKSDVLKSSTELKITFLGVARGANYDHSFKIKIPMAGIEGIFGDEGTENDGEYYYVTVFKSTRSVLPPDRKPDSWFATNTASQDDTCDPQVKKVIYMTINDDFAFDEDKPYEPYITVWPSKVVGEGDSYDLYLWEVSGRDTWITKTGKEYPNGIIIPDDWQWPYETVPITDPYPDFTSITEGWNPDWANNLAVDSLIWTCTP